MELKSKHLVTQCGLYRLRDLLLLNSILVEHKHIRGHFCALSEYHLVPFIFLLNLCAQEDGMVKVCCCRLWVQFIEVWLNWSFINWLRIRLIGMVFMRANVTLFSDHPLLL